MKTCLVVDDTAFDRMIIEQCATKAGLYVHSASNGEEALAICNSTFPDCILLDWEMERMNGIELMKKIRQMEKGREVPIIICTSHDHSSYIGHAYVSGANSYIAKPLTQDKLENELIKLKVL